MGSIRVTRPYLGVGFGVKTEATALDFCAAELARLTRGSVKAVYTREEKKPVPPRGKAQRSPINPVP